MGLERGGLSLQQDWGGEHRERHWQGQGVSKVGTMEGCARQKGGGHGCGSDREDGKAKRGGAEGLTQGEVKQGKVCRQAGGVYERQRRDEFVQLQLVTHAPLCCVAALHHCAAVWSL
jgi:hypothetical protein